MSGEDGYYRIVFAYAKRVKVDFRACVSTKVTGCDGGVFIINRKQTHMVWLAWLAMPIPAQQIVLQENINTVKD